MATTHAPLRMAPPVPPTLRRLHPILPDRPTLDLRWRGYAVFPVPLPHSPWGVLENGVPVGGLLELDAMPLFDGLTERLLRLRDVICVQFDLGGPITIGRASYLAAALRWLGPVNVYDHEPRAYLSPDLRQVLALKPDLIV